MARTRERAKGRRGGEKELFAYLPHEVMESAALATAPTYAFKVLAVLQVGKARELNGLMMCSESYAAKFGIEARITVHRALQLLTDRGLIVRTRRVQAFRKAATQWGVTWWPICFRDNEKLLIPEPALHSYRAWTITSAGNVETGESSHSLGGVLTSAGNVKHTNSHIQGEAQLGNYHIQGGGHSKSLGLGAQLEQARMADAVAVARATPGIPADALAKRARCSEAIAHRALQQIDSESRA